MERVGPGGEVLLRAFPGEYVVAAFDDMNGNLVPDEGEPVLLSAQQPRVRLSRGEPAAEVRLSLLDGVPPSSAQLVSLRRASARSPHQNLGVVADLEWRRFDDELGVEGAWEPAKFERSGRAGLYMLDAFDPDRAAVVFVHGIGGTPRDFAALSAGLDRSKYQAWAFYYPSAMALGDTAARLGRALNLLLSHARPSALVLVGHSMGGLVAMEYARQSKEGGGAPAPDAVITIASPFAGLAAARVGLALSPTVMPCWRDIARGSAFLEELRAADLGRLSHHLIYAYRPAGAGRKGDGTVPIDSQLDERSVQRASSVRGVEALHTAVLQDAVALRHVRWILDATSLASANINK